ncbi:protein kinase domain-containing protein, partial [Syntrophaceticus schinkii]|uniref:protein kinase domain-containing protein n=1 Tax=Syntrophaceticus schinkii TaxID=499207 RepID=UPI0012EB4DD4
MMKKDEKTLPDSIENTATVSDNATIDDDYATVDAAAIDNAALDDDATVDDDAAVPDNEAARYEGKAVIIAKGRTLLDTYRVESDAIEGGMGSVWRVHHTGWNVDLAMKQPQAKAFQTKKQKEKFINECDAWINLGLHPHIVSCYYVREIGGVPTIFSEWMDGGSLADVIRNGSLYRGTGR